MNAVRELEAELALYPHDHFARALLGHALVLRARDAPMHEKRALAARGFAELDAAVAAVPDDPQPRLLRARNAATMPRFLDRSAVAREDFAHLLARVDRGDPAGDPGLERRVCFHAGAFALRERRHEAVTLLERAVRAPGHEPSEEIVQSMLALARLELTPASHADVEEGA
ncbi:hypothetical protein [Congregicoccus parvus]|uniref:hypothetical protein n=1 Tax=Congregicoccus parvus TaxID=3081749 RepID=UPI003FA6071B